MKRNALGIILTLQLLILIGQWFGVPGPSTAMAQIPDSGAQRAQMIEQLKAINGKLDQIITLMSATKPSGHGG
jgi:hypothetical protein